MSNQKATVQISTCWHKFHESLASFKIVSFCHFAFINLKIFDDFNLFKLSMNSSVKENFLSVFLKIIKISKSSDFNTECDIPP